MWFPPTVFWHRLAREEIVMHMLSSFRLTIRACLSKIHPVDKSLILIMFLLLLQSAYNMFSQAAAQQTISEIDIIVRTSAASIFGYFLSGNFVRHTASVSPSPAGQQTHTIMTADYSQMRSAELFTAEPSSADMDSSEASQPTQALESSPLKPSDPSCLQVIIAAGIGLFCLCALLLLRWLAQQDPAIAQSDSVSATVVQFRDFISGCVGFLIGHPTQSNTQT